MDKIRFPKDETLKSLIQLGTKGFFPLFSDSWLREFQDKKLLKFTKQEKLKAKKLIILLEKHKGFERKRNILHSMVVDERRLFIKAFLKLVEGEIINQKPEIQ